MLDFIKNHPFLVGWVLFVLLVYIYAYLDYAYYKYNFNKYGTKEVICAD